jgi:rhodanese-related sulfurtransferase
LNDLQPGSAPDWFVIDSWAPIFERLRLAPTDLPGVTALADGSSARRPWPYEVHRTHLPLLGLTPPPSLAVASTVSSADVLRPHQHVAVDFIRSRRGVLLADEQRTGKSAAVMYAFEPERGPLLVSGPVAARAVWSEWAHRRFGPCVLTVLGHPCAACARFNLTKADGFNRPSFLSLDGRSYNPNQVIAHRPHVLFCTHAVASTWRELATSLLGRGGIDHLGMMAIDECHLSGATNRKSLTYESFKWLNSLAGRVVLMSGTPMPNKPAGLWSLLDLAAPTAFGDFWTCARRYFDARPTPHGWQANGLSRESEFNTRLTEIMLRRTWREVAPSLPRLTRATETVLIENTTRARIDEAASRLRSAKGAKTIIGILATLRRLFAEAKLPGAVEAAAQAVQQGHSVILWCWHSDVAARATEGLQRKGINVYGPITGSVTGGRREHVLDAARDGKGARVLVASMSALGTAVSLTWADQAIFAELDWNPHFIQQAEMRTFDPARPSSVTYLVADCHTDESLASALLAKLDRQGTLKLRAGAGDVSEVLSRSLSLDDQTLAELAKRLCDNAIGEV